MLAHADYDQRFDRLCHFEVQTAFDFVYTSLKRLNTQNPMLYTGSA